VIRSNEEGVRCGSGVRVAHEAAGRQVDERLAHRDQRRSRLGGRGKPRPLPGRCTRRLIAVRSLLAIATIAADLRAGRYNRLSAEFQEG
jgi:hypothetical protein